MLQNFVIEEVIVQLLRLKIVFAKSCLEKTSFCISYQKVLNSSLSKTKSVLLLMSTQMFIPS